MRYPRSYVKGLGYILDQAYYRSDKDSDYGVEFDGLQATKETERS